MSDLMRDAVISMPLELAMGDEWSRFQFHDRAQELLKQVHSLEAERDQWEVDCREEVIMRREAEAERDRLREALSNLVYACEKSRIWNGMGWTYHPVHPVHYQKRMEEGRQALAGSR